MLSMSLKCLLEGFGLGVLVVILALIVIASLAFVIVAILTGISKLARATPLKRLADVTPPPALRRTGIALLIAVFVAGIAFPITVVGIELLKRIGSACVVR